MTKKLLLLVFAVIGLGLIIRAQDVVVLKIMGGERPTIAIADFRGAGDAAPFMNVFNQTLFNDVEDSGLLKMAAKSFFPLVVPQQPSDFQQPAVAAPPGRKAPWLTAWSGPPVRHTYLAFGYAATQNDQIVL